MLKYVSYVLKKWLLFLLIIGSSLSQGQIVLLGDNAPFKNINDGDFNQVWASWRAEKQSPYWTCDTKNEKEPMGLHYGTLYSMSEKGIAKSVTLDANPLYQNPKEGDLFYWSFGADLEYISKGTISLSLVFGDKERILAKKVKLIGSDKKVEHFKGTYTLTNDDVKEGFPLVKATFYSEKDVKVYLHYVNISVKSPETVGPKLKAKVLKNSIKLEWADQLSNKTSKFNIYRSKDQNKGYKKIGETEKLFFVDEHLINGIEYTYVVTRLDKNESSGSNKVVASVIDKIAPKPPLDIHCKIYDTEVKIEWKKSKSNDVKNYSVYRGDAEGNNMREIAHDLRKNSYMDFTPIKDEKNTYVVYAHDYSGNRSIASPTIKAKVRTVLGASFSDLILPMPIHNTLEENIWGVKGVIPRDVQNGIEAANWSYWGGRPVKDTDGKYHMCVTRWPANGIKGHWEWPNSTVAHVVADKPTGPYKVNKAIAYGFAKGLGHNPDIVLLNDGTYMLYSLINWEATLFTSKSMRGPWKRLGIMEVDLSTSKEHKNLNYRYYRNLSGVHLDDGRFLFVTKGGGMMISKDTNPLGPYTALTKPIQGNEIIPEKYRNSNYEDPVLWKDEVQYHMIINAFLDYRAIYLRSPDGIHWKFNKGTAYTPDNTTYVDGTRTHWYKLERPHVLQDKYGRATHLSLAVIDVPKANDLAGDNHNSKNIVLPLVVPKRITLLNKETISDNTKKIKILVYSEKDFNAQTDIDFSSLRFGAVEEVDFGRGCSVEKTIKKGKDLIIEFNAYGHGFTTSNFTGKLLGKTKEGELLFGFTKLAK